MLAVLAASLGACALDSEPTQMCGGLELGLTSTRSLADSAPTVVALSDGAGRITIVRACDPLQQACDGAELVTQTLPYKVIPDQLLLTASGRWLTYRVGPNLFRVDLEQAEPEPVGGPGDVHELVGSLRGGDWLIYRTWGERETTSISDSELWAYYVGEDDELPVDELTGERLTRPHFRVGEGFGSGFDLRVAALGHRHVVARRILGNGEEELYLIRIAPARRHDEFGSSSRGKPILLARGQRFTRVLITSGPSPLEHGDPWEFQHEVPTDVRVIATAGAGSTARTLIFDVSDTSQIANFEGAVVSSPVPLEDVAGLDPVSPDGTHLAYITPRGSLALRNLDSQGACMIRPATAAQHVLAGFGADATLYFESHERGEPEPNQREANEVDVVYAYDPATEQFTALTDAKSTWRLYAVPSRRYEDEHGEPRPWAVVAIDGFYAAGPGARPQPLHYEDVRFLPRGDESLWLLEGEESSGFNDPNNYVHLRRVQPLSGAGEGLEFDREAADPTVLEAGGVRDRFTRSYLDKSPICLSTSQSASRTTPWATSCSTPDKPTSYLNSGLPAAEHD